MGIQKYQRAIQELFDKSPVVDFKSIKRIISEKNNSSQYTKQLIRNLIKQGKIKKICKGKYTSLNENSLAVFCFQPAYLGLQDALSFHNLWEQETIPIIITSRNVRVGTKKVLDSNVLIKKVSKKYLFGFEYYKQDNLALPYSDIEKTFIDMIHFKQQITKETLMETKKKLDKKKLKVYLNKYPKIFQKRVLKIIT